MERKDIVIVIPIYKKNIDFWEKRSLLQCISILGKYDIVFVTFKELELVEYCNINNNAIFAFFDKSYFEGIDGYNRLCLSNELYSRFSSYKYMLIYQLDAWVFSDELLEWCIKGYDYIGAPWPVPYYNSLGESITVGNGGLSLRRIEAFRKPFAFWGLTRYMNTKMCLSFCKRLGINYMKGVLYCLGYKNNFRYFRNKSKGYLEDVFWSVVLSETRFKLIIPEETIARSFAFECNPSVQFNLNNSKLPFGCHAFQKHEFETFWSKYIK